MSEPNILIHKLDHNNKAIFILTINRPKQYNAVNNHLLEEMHQHLEEISKAPNLGALIIKSDNQKAFCTGVDVDYIKSLTNEQAAIFFTKLAEMLEKIINIPCPTIASVDGYAFGAGADIALSCDLRIANKSASFRFPGPQFGLILGTQRLMSEVGPSVVRHLTLTNQVITANNALQYGLLHEIADNGSAFELALKYAEKTTGISEYTYSLVKEICSQDNKLATPPELTKESVEQADFSARFSDYVGQVKRNKKR